MVDADFLVTEYDQGTARAIIDYKSCDGGKPTPISAANLSGICSLGHPAILPVAVVYYWSDTWAYVAIPLNPAANEVFAPRCEWFTERQYVWRLCALRGRDPRQARGVQWDALNEIEPPAIALTWFGEPSKPLPAPGNLFRYAGEVMNVSKRTVELIPVQRMPPVFVKDEEEAAT